MSIFFFYGVACCDSALNLVGSAGSVFPVGMDSVRRTYTIMRGRHIDKRVPSKEFLSALDKAETAGFLSFFFFFFFLLFELVCAHGVMCYIY